jgi:DUF2075 family protein
MYNVLADPDIPLKSEVSIEYEIPLTSKRVDFIISGSDALGKDDIVIVELKQWTTAQKIDDIQVHSVMTYVNKKVRPEPHPSYQAYSYAVHLESYSQDIQDKGIKLYPCAYCHNFREEDRKVLEDPIYQEWIKEAPLFIKKYIVKKSADGDLLYKIDNGKIRPAKALQDCLASMLKGKKEFQLLDDQSTIYDQCIEAIDKSEKDGLKRILIIQGGPGTGKSVLAINLLCDVLKKGLNASYCTKNGAPRSCYVELLSKDDIKKQVSIKELFRSPFALCNCPRDFYDCLIIDEAHRLVTKMFRDYKGENQIKECIEASKVSIFLIDEDQRITTKDIGTVDGIIDWAHKEGIDDNRIIHGDELFLRSQFRCNGSDGYIAFLDDLLGLRQTANKTFDLEGFDFEVFDNSCEMRDKLRELNMPHNKAKMVSGYCYDWNVKNNRGDWDIMLKDGFQAKWNLPENSMLWAVLSSSFEEVGCIHTCQGLKFDYVGVIIGKDLIYRNGKVMTSKNAISLDDNSSGIRKCHDEALADRLIRNTYKVLMTRGQKGCFVYCEDKELRDYLKTSLKKLPNNQTNYLIG